MINAPVTPPMMPARIVAAFDALTAYADIVAHVSLLKARD
jgi:hypothetical protein